MHHPICNFAGVDWATDAHAVAVVDPAGGMLAEFDIGHTAAGLSDMCRRLTRAHVRHVGGLRDQGEDVWPRPDSPTPLRIEDARLHGAWGLALTWNDGHTTGIFPFELLRRWHEGGAPAARSVDSE